MYTEHSYTNEHEYLHVLTVYTVQCTYTVLYMVNGHTHIHMYNVLYINLYMHMYEYTNLFTLIYSTSLHMYTFITRL